MPFHVEIRDGRERARAFNLTEAEVHERFLVPLSGRETFIFQDLEFDPRKTKLTVVEGEKLAPGQLGLGQGWTNAAKHGTDVTARFVNTRPPTRASAVNLELTGRLKERILGRLAAGPLALGDGFSLTGDLLAGHRVSERLGAVELAVWELLHGGGAQLHARAGEPPLPQDRWEALLLDPASWLTPGPGAPVLSSRSAL